MLEIDTLGGLKEKGYKTKSIREELRENLINAFVNHRNVFDEIHGYDETVIPDLHRAILSMHHINLLGLRGQAKTRLARLMIYLLDEYIPIVKGSELNDDPYRPLSKYAKDLVSEKGDNTPIAWLHREKRYTEKLATPDVSIADLIGDIDPIKAANLHLSYSDERVIHYGLIPRSNRCLFIINELPDLQARIQVALFNILQEGDIQIRGFQLRIPLDIQFVFTANPEDYTNRGSIITPLKDRIDSQILTHYPKNIAIAKKITQQEAYIKPFQKEKIKCFSLTKDLIEQIAFEARKSEYIDARSGVSSRITISAYENLISSAERRMLLNNENRTFVRMGDIWSITPSISGKIELVYEGEQEGIDVVGKILIGKAIRNLFTHYFPNPEKEKKKKKQDNVYKKIIQWFEEKKPLTLFDDASNIVYRKNLLEISPIKTLVHDRYPKEEDLQLFLMEFTLHGLSEFSIISKKIVRRGVDFGDLMNSMISISNDDSLENS